VDILLEINTNCKVIIFINVLVIKCCFCCGQLNNDSCYSDDSWNPPTQMRTVKG